MPLRMEIDHISYIFGSFARRRQSQEVSSSKRRSIEQPKICHDRSKSAPHTPSKSEAPVSRPKNECTTAAAVESHLKCPLCREDFVEPRVLPCLHTFCTRCLHQIEMQAISKSDEAKSRRNTISGDSSRENRGTLAARKHTINVSLSCPSCGSNCGIPPNGIKMFPVNYLIQHRLVLAALNSHSTKLLCDLCTGDVSATSRCSECALSLCQECSDNHTRQRNHVDHEVLRLEEARRRGITKVRRHIMCQIHLDNELSVFCSTCCQVVCRECLVMAHRGHVNESVTRAAKIYSSNVKTALVKTKSITEKKSGVNCKLQATSQRVENHCNRMQGEIDNFIESYIKAVEQHRKTLHQEVHSAKIETLRLVDRQLNELQRQLNNAKDVLMFTDDLLKEGTEVEFLTFVKPVLKRLEMCNDVYIPELTISESLQFLPEEASQETWNSCPLYGIVSTQVVAPGHCILLPEGLQNLRAGKKADIILELRDRHDSPLQRGGEAIVGELKHIDASSAKSSPVQVEDRKNGTYRLHFTPEIAGKYTLSVVVKGQPIKDNPLTLRIRAFRPHHGTYHCCSFCSSGGLKDATCGCGGKMPGGYKGCGHGHEGHPGRRHWSCCGNMLEHSECGKRNSTHYQFTL